MLILLSLRLLMTIHDGSSLTVCVRSLVASGSALDQQIERSVFFASLKTEYYTLKTVQTKEKTELVQKRKQSKLTVFLVSSK